MKEPVGLTEFGEGVLDTILAGYNSAGAYLGSSVTVKEVVELANLYGLDAYEEEKGKIYLSWHFEDMATAFAAKLMELEYIGLETVLKELG